MKTERLSEVLHLRVIPKMKDTLQRFANQLGIRPVDVARMSLALMLNKNMFMVETYSHLEVENSNHDG